MKSKEGIICLLVLIPLLAVYSCKQAPPTEKAMRETLGKRVSLNMFKIAHHNRGQISFDELRNAFDYISIVYLQNDCSPCYTKFISWNHSFDSIGGPQNHSILFIVKGKSYNDFMNNVWKYGLEREYNHFVVMDPNDIFSDENIQIPLWMLENSILIDKNNSILMIGNPFLTEQTTKDFFLFCKK